MADFIKFVYILLYKYGNQLIIKSIIYHICIKSILIITTDYQLIKSKNQLITSTPCGKIERQQGIILLDVS